MENTPVGPGQTYEHGSRPGRLACQLCSQEFAASERKAHEDSYMHNRLTRRGKAFYEEVLARGDPTHKDKATGRACFMGLARYISYTWSGADSTAELLALFAAFDAIYPEGA